MTLAITALTTSGIVLTADSRQTYRNIAGAIRIGSDSAMKLFRLTKTCGVAISGKAFLSENGIHIKDAGYFINEFTKTEKLEEQNTEDIAEKLNHYLSGIYVAREFESLKTNIKDGIDKLGGSDLEFSEPDGNQITVTYIDRDGNAQSEIVWIDTINMIVAGIDMDKVGRAYSVSVPKGITNKRDTEICGALWVGQTDVLSRIVGGWAPEIAKLEFMKNGPIPILEELSKLEYNIGWGTITLQDAVDFCVLMTRTTESIQRFSDGTRLSPGGIPGVGGEIDIAIITPEKGFTWFKKKKLSSEGVELLLEQE